MAVRARVVVAAAEAWEWVQLVGAEAVRAAPAAVAPATVEAAEVARDRVVAVVVVEEERELVAAAAEEEEVRAVREAATDFWSTAEAARAVWKAVASHRHHCRERCRGCCYRRRHRHCRHR